MRLRLLIKWSAKATVILFHNLRKWTVLAVFIGMLGFTAATHTVGFLTDLTSSFIQAVSGLTTTAVQARTDLKAQRNQHRTESTRQADIRSRLRNENLQLSNSQQGMGSQSDLNRRSLNRLETENILLRTSAASQATQVKDLSAANAILHRQSQNQLEVMQSLRTSRAELSQTNEALRTQQAIIKA